MASPPKIGFLGPLGTYSHDAAVRAFKQGSWLPQSSLRDCMHGLWNGDLDFAVMPFENSTNGSVVYTLDILRELYHKNTLDDADSSNSFQISSEVYVPINHCLISNNSNLGSITKVYSHPQVWGQCDIWYEENLKKIEKIDVSSTSRAVELAKQDPTSAAIAGRAAAELHHVPIQVADIANNSSNTTRFLVFGSKSSQPVQSDSKYHTLVSFTVEHSMPGALCQALSAFGRQSLNMTQICSRPSGRDPWTYVFFVEIEGHSQDSKVDAALQELQHYCLEVRRLGSFVHVELQENSS